jgi:hypothetical protein
MLSSHQCLGLPSGLFASGFFTETCPYPEPDQVHASPSHFLKVHLNVILPSMPGSSKWSLCLRFLHQNSVFTSALPRMCYMPWFIHILYLIISEYIQPSINLACTVRSEGHCAFIKGVGSDVHEP